MIVYDDESKQYCGTKFVDGNEAGRAYGKDNWQMFFVHLTALGLAKGEKCKFEGPEEAVEKIIQESQPHLGFNTA